MSLTPKQEKFCIAYIETGNASEAYRRAYNSGKMKPETVNRNAKSMLDDNKIATRIGALQKPAVEKAQVTLEQHLNDLKRLRDLAEADQKWQAAIQAEVSRGKVSGLYTERHELTGKDGQPVEVEHKLSSPILEKLSEIYKQETSE